MLKRMLLVLFGVMGVGFVFLIVDDADRIFAQGPKGSSPRSVTGTLGGGFTYQGTLKQGTTPVDSTCDIAYALYDAATSGNLVAAPITQTGRSVSKGAFTSAPLDFGANVFNGADRYLQLSFKCGTDSGFTPLTELQRVTAAPYALFAQRTASYQNVLVVAKSNGDFTTIGDALASIGTAASATNPYLIYVAPGTYTETVVMKPYVDIEGAGEALTKITQSGSAGFNGTVSGSNNAELRFLTVENTGGSNYGIGVYNNNAGPRLTHVTIKASGVSTNYGVYSSNSPLPPVLTNVSVTVSGGSAYGIFSGNTATVMTDVSITTSGSSGAGIYNSAASPTLTNVNITAGGGSNNTGIINQIGSPTLMNVVISVSGGGSNFGLSNSFGSSPKMTNVSIAVSGGSSENNGIYNGCSICTQTIQNSVIVATGTNAYGIRNVSGLGIIQVNSSFISATTTITNAAAYTTKVGASMLAGTVLAGSGALKCASAYNATYDPLAADCQ